MSTFTHTYRVAVPFDAETRTQHVILPYQLPIAYHLLPIPVIPSGVSSLLVMLGGGDQCLEMRFKLPYKLQHIVPTDSVCEWPRVWEALQDNYVDKGYWVEIMAITIIVLD